VPNAGQKVEVVSNSEQTSGKDFEALQESEPLTDSRGFSNLDFFSRLSRMSESEWPKIPGWPGYRVYRSEINEEGKTRRKRGNRKAGTDGISVNQCAYLCSLRE
jgi:hypothetical protein